MAQGRADAVRLGAIALGDNHSQQSLDGLRRDLVRVKFATGRRDVSGPHMAFAQDDGGLLDLFARSLFACFDSLEISILEIVELLDRFGANFFDQAVLFGCWLSAAADLADKVTGGNAGQRQCEHWLPGSLKKRARRRAAELIEVDAQRVTALSAIACSIAEHPGLPASW